MNPPSVAAKRTIIIIVNGEDAELTLPVRCRLRGALRMALKRTLNTGRPFEEWRVYDSFANHLDDSVEVGVLTERARLFAVLKVGAGGHRGEVAMLKRDMVSRFYTPELSSDFLDLPADHRGRPCMRGFMGPQGGQS